MNIEHSLKTVLLGTALGLLSLAMNAQAAVDISKSPTLTKINTNNVLVIGHRTSSIPFSYYDENQKPIGFAQDICNKIIAKIKTDLKKPDLQVRLMPLTPQNRLTLVQNGTVDLACGVATNLKARQEQVTFSDTYFVAGTRLLVNKKSGIKDFKDIRNKAVVTLAGTTSEKILRKMNDDDNANITIQGAKEYAEAFLILQSGRVSAFMMDDVLLSGARTLARNPDDWEIVGASQSVEPYGFFMKKDDPVFKELVDGVMTTMMKDGEMAKLYNKWFLNPVPPKNANFNMPMSDLVKKAYANPNDKAVN
jgi:glutamate/aspartate transport system substrate-binding protein